MSDAKDQAARAQERIYEDRADAYDELVSAEDADGKLVGAVHQIVDVRGAVVVDVGAGTGRLTRGALASAKHVHLVDRAAPMLEVARARLAASGRTDTSIHVADARSLPLPTASVDVAIAGWVFGHFRHWMPDGWQGEVDRAVAEMHRVVKPGGTVIIIETLGTGHTTPRTHAALDEYFAHLEATHGFLRTWVRTDYVFDSVDTAARVLGAFFGDDFAARVRREGWSRVPECTGLFSVKKALPAS